MSVSHQALRFFCRTRKGAGFNFRIDLSAADMLVWMHPKAMRRKQYEHLVSIFTGQIAVFAV
ncbi:hypothetical protein CHCC15381_3007 [Bacillus paralicheniformis]|uniref:Uncharacterized protein n=1 Tax=Bacillus paralicheniformis TaxID=1648923 RepID=A0ABY3G2B6_9BACI|nr:hypothetical protein CHCC15381_3007 [Bacillus paralicheniformis]